jgi:ABC-type multidrug transport system ATPase subunit
LLDLAKADSGHVDMDGINPAQSEEWKAFTGAYIDETFLIDYLSSQEYLAFLAKANGLETTPELPIMPDDPQKLIRDLTSPFCRYRFLQYR